MAHPKRRKFNLRKVRLATSVAIGALASSDVISTNISAASTNPYRLMSVDLTYSLTDLGATSDDGQQFGLAHSDYSAAEVEECLEAQASIDIGNKVEQERANRLVRNIGQITGNAGTLAGMSFNDGVSFPVKLNWHMAIGDQLNLWVRNGSSTVYTTGALIVMVGNLWVKDQV